MKSYFFYLLIPLSFGYTACTTNAGNQQSIAVSDVAENSSDTTSRSMTADTRVQILLPTQYRRESGYPENTDKDDWYALYFDKEAKEWQWTIKKTALQVSYGTDECVGDSILIVQSDKNAILFLRGINNLQENPETALTDKLLLPGRNVTFRITGKSYGLLSMGTYLGSDDNYLSQEDQKLKTEAELMENVIENYQLSFLADDGNVQLIATQERIQSDGHTPRLLWAGDLNGDGLPDLIIDIASWYESQQILLFLSDKNNKEQLKKVAEIVVNNDC